MEAIQSQKKNLHIARRDKCKTPLHFNSLNLNNDPLTAKLQLEVFTEMFMI